MIIFLFIYLNYITLYTSPIIKSIIWITHCWRTL